MKSQTEHQDLFKDSARHVEAIVNLRDRGAQAAYVYLLIAAAQAGLRSEAELTKITAVKLYGQDNRYDFAFIVNQADLLFYIRKPLLKELPQLEPEALGRFEDAKTNNAGEVTIRVRDTARASEIAHWLFNSSE